MDYANHWRIWIGRIIPRKGFFAMKLFILDVTRTAVVLAESEEEARLFAEEVDEWESHQVCVYEVSETVELPLEWEDDCLVYHNGDADIALGEAKTIAKVSVEREEHLAHEAELRKPAYLRKKEKKEKKQ